jgi:hypothetical protein
MIEFVILFVLIIALCILLMYQEPAVGVKKESMETPDATPGTRKRVLFDEDVIERKFSKSTGNIIGRDKTIHINDN